MVRNFLAVAKHLLVLTYLGDKLHSPSNMAVFQGIAIRNIADKRTFNDDLLS
jgi:hypothetical protein